MNTPEDEDRVPMARAAVPSPGRELSELLQTPGQHMAVATIEPDGAPHLTAVWYCLTDDHLIGFTVRADSRKAANLARDPRLTVMVEAGTAHGELRGMQLTGTALLSDALDVKLMIHERIAARYPTRRSRDIRTAMGRRLAVLVAPTQIRAWDHRPADRR